MIDTKPIAYSEEYSESSALLEILLLNKVGLSRHSLKNLRKRENPKPRNSTFPKPKKKLPAERLSVIRQSLNSPPNSRSTDSENE